MIPSEGWGVNLSHLKPESVVEPVAVLLLASTLLLVALVLLTVALIRLRLTARDLQKALAEQSRSRDRAALLLTVASAVNSSLALGEVLNVALTQAGRLMGATAGALYLLAAGGIEMRRQAAYNLVENAAGASRTLDAAPLGPVIAANRPQVIALDAEHAPGLTSGGKPKHVLVVPVQRSGRLVGAFELYVPGPGRIDDDQSELLLGVAAETAMAITNAQLFQAQEESALTDELTKLANRRSMAQRFLEEMQRARRHHTGLAFLMVDIDHFKEINDTHGHLRGDAVLAEMAKILDSGKRDTDVCARYGGDEFGLILGDSNPAGAMTVAERIRTRVQSATFPGGLNLTVSVGVAVTENDALFTSLIEKADQALYAAKQSGRNRCRLVNLGEIAAGRRE
jgi:diguanylate cyclase (GGDEF)-like protein